jgi:EAL domain-containing protein (putative c-di-GMP-specific phosphodiesterase class I)/GGDEF domain-containing protein
MAEHSQENMGSKLVFQDIFQNTFGQSEETADFYHRLYAEIDKFDNGVKYITAENGSEYLLTYQLLDKNSDTYMITYFNVDPVLAEVDDVVFRTAITCIFLIVLTLMLVMFVWLNSMKTTSLVEKMAYEDPITNGKNLNYFKVKSHEILKTYRAFSYLVERYDIANFRYINEAYGHKRADQLLKGCLELADEVFLESELCARMDSAQFVLLSVNDSSSAVRWASYRQSVNEYARTIGIKYPIRFKVGIYQLRDSDPDMDTVIDRANAARKLISSHSKEMTKTYSDSIVKDMRRMDQIESDMMRALNDGEFKVYLQQKQDIEKNEVCGAEALIRWVKADGTIVSPVDFIPLFEKNGFIEQLDYYVLETVCSRQRDLIDENKIPLPISVNQSKVLLNNSDYVRNVERIFNRYKLPRNLVTLEVTESVFLNDEESIENIVKELKELGISTAMDDFGKGYSSLTLLKNVSFDILKIDRGFVSDSLTSAKSRWILSRIIELAYGLGMKIVCEGIETKEQLENVRRLKCRVIQGFYFGKPIPMEEFIEKYIKEVS